MPSTENVAIAIWKELAPHVNAMDCKLHCIKLYETENNYVEYFGEEQKASIRESGGGEN